jgi:Holliday junction resolvasome RuvABC endonuclease subunit
MPDQTLRIFVDPASISTGWAAFRGDQLLESGTIKVKATKLTAERMGPIYAQYSMLFARLKPDEVHIEQFAGRVNHKCVMSVAAIYVAAWMNDIWADQDCNVSSWQSWAQWHKARPLAAEYTNVKSEDELAALCIGRWYLETRL